ncbi:hypothetical protein M408DRAFT_27671 [Serendipita vermifera MAFF 305830]|uniref:Methyltransferase domain-containing protein n=1 Tax=Serendipita vermifera MAFF 305830 TaxID=933852 RepID=A0A0C3AUK5_SERVB|nr:hypothetical protein M408DRAFT_27671 [Serendipita vermifera MAFF 305830]
MSGTRRLSFNLEDNKESRVTSRNAYTDATLDSNRLALVKREGGRDFNVINETYLLPTDSEEWNRLDKQHRAITLGLGGLYPAPDVVRAVLAPQEGVSKRVLDLGCGTGIWSIEMAREFPHCYILGIDLAPVPVTGTHLPSNCRFEMNDICLGLPQLRDQFDVVFARLIALGLKDSRQTLADIQGCLKPGGILIWIDGDYDLFSGWPMVYRPFVSSSNPTGSYTVRVCYELQRSGILGGSDVKTAGEILDEGFWSNGSLLDPDTCKAASIFLPIEGDQLQRDRLKYIGMLLRQDFIGVTEAAQKIFLKVGWPKETVDLWIARMKDECANATSGMRLRIAWGRRRAASGSPAPPLPKVVLEDTSESIAMGGYPFYEEFDTEEQALAAAVIRNRPKDIPAPPLPFESTD